jgi:hypothetical protein
LRNIYCVGFFIKFHQIVGRHPVALGRRSGLSIMMMHGNKEDRGFIAVWSLSLFVAFQLLTATGGILGAVAALLAESAQSAGGLLCFFCE